MRSFWDSQNKNLLKFSIQYHHFPFLPGVMGQHSESQPHATVLTRHFYRSNLYELTISTAYFTALQRRHKKVPYTVLCS
jgi:hypothetical protein